MLRRILRSNELNFHQIVYIRFHVERCRCVAAIQRLRQPNALDDSVCMYACMHACVYVSLYVYVCMRAGVCVHDQEKTRSS